VSRGSRYRVRYDDPDGCRYGIPTYPWRCAPDGLATRRQLSAAGLRPGGQQPVAQIMWRQWRRDAVAYLYAVAAAKPKRIPTPAQLVAVGLALKARRTCPVCRVDAGYVLPRTFGVCVDCAERSGQLAPTPGEGVAA
jgi:hypothetical protein